jgi:hypothetical protein
MQQNDAQLRPANALKLSDLEDCSTRDLKRLWRQHWNDDLPDRVNRDLLILGLAWDLQALSNGGLARETIRRIEILVSRLASSILNKVGQLTASPVLRNIFGQVAPKFDLAHAMDHRGIFIANLAKGPDRGAGVEFARVAIALAFTTRRHGA